MDYPPAGNDNTRDRQVPPLVPYSIPAKPATWRGQRLQSINEGVMLCVLEQKGFTDIQYQPPVFLSARWGRWQPDALCSVPVKGRGVCRVYWEFKYAGWLQGKDWAGKPDRMLSAYQDSSRSLPVIAQPDGFLRLVVRKGNGLDLHRLIWFQDSKGLWGLRGESAV